MKNTCGVVSVIIGREYSLQPLLNYFKEVEVPLNMEVTLYLVMGCDYTFEVLLKDKIKELQLELKYKEIYFLRGNLKLYHNMSWDEWENFTRLKTPHEKHRSALNNIEIGLQAAKNKTYLHFVDDDTIPHKNTIKDLLTSYENIDNCGLVSGLYFNKKWSPPLMSVSDIEQNRGICGSYKKRTWEGCTIDELSVQDYQDMGFVGNGCMLISGEDVKNILPLSEYRDQNDDIAPPDFIICRRIRQNGKKVSIVPSVIPQHLDYNGNPVGLQPEYLENIKKSTTTYNFIVTDYDKYIDYKLLSKKFDKILIISYNELHKQLPKYLNDIENLEIITKSIRGICEQYDDYKNYYKLTGKTMINSVFEEAHKVVNYRSDYIMHYYDKFKNSIFKVPTLDSKNLKKLLNQKP